MTESKESEDMTPRTEAVKAFYSKESKIKAPKHSSA